MLHIVYSAILEDCLSITARFDDMINEYKQIIDKNLDFAQIGNVFKMDTTSSIKMLKSLFDDKHSDLCHDMFDERFAFVIGYLCRIATDKEFEEINCLPDEIKLYYDARIFREYYMRNINYSSESAINRIVIDGNEMTKEVAIEQIKILLLAFIKRAIIRMHTFKPGYEDVNIWLKNFFERQKKLNMEVESYATAIINLNAKEVDDHIDSSFYNVEDSIIKIAKRARLGENIDQNDVNLALNCQPISIYGKALRTSCLYVKAINEFLQSQVPLNKLISLVL